MVHDSHRAGLNWLNNKAHVSFEEDIVFDVDRLNSSNENDAVKGVIIIRLF